MASSNAVSTYMCAPGCIESGDTLKMDSQAEAICLGCCLEACVAATDAADQQNSSLSLAAIRTSVIDVAPIATTAWSPSTLSSPPHAQRPALEGQRLRGFKQFGSGSQLHGCRFFLRHGVCVRGLR